MNTITMDGSPREPVAATRRWDRDGAIESVLHPSGRWVYIASNRVDGEGAVLDATDGTLVCRVPEGQAALASDADALYVVQKEQRAITYVALDASYSARTVVCPEGLQLDRVYQHVATERDVLFQRGETGVLLFDRESERFRPLFDVARQR